MNWRALNSLETHTGTLAFSIEATDFGVHEFSATHHCVINPCWKEIVQALGVNEAPVVVEEGPEYQEYKLERKQKNTRIKCFSGEVCKPTKETTT